MVEQHASHRRAVTRRRFVGTVLAVAATLTLAACGSDKPKSGDTTAAAAPDTTAAAAPDTTAAAAPDTTAAAPDTTAAAAPDTTAAAAATTAAAATEYRIIYLSSAVDANISAGIDAMKATIAEREKADGVKIDLEVLDATMNSDKQISQAQNAITKKPNVMMVDPVDIGPLATVLQDAKKAGIKLFGFRPSPNDPANIWDATTDIAQLEVIMKTNLTDWMTAQLDAKTVAAWNVGLLYGAAAQTMQLQRGDVVKDLAKTNPAVKVVAEKIADWQLQVAQDATTNFLTSEQDLNLIVAANNQMAFGAVNAITTANKAGKVQVATYDVDADTIKAVIDGKIAYATGFTPAGISTGVVTTAINLALGQPTDRFAAPIYVVTKDNAAEMLTKIG